jgi:hypothetical protein
MSEIVKTPHITIDSDEQSIQHRNHSKKLFYNTEGFTDNKQYNKFIKVVEKTIRGSLEYREWVSYLKESCDVHACKISGETYSDCSVDIHHYPFNLYQLVDIAIETQLGNGNKFSTFDIASEVMSWHFKDIVGYIPLIKSLHEKYHNGLLYIPLYAACGNWRTILSTMNVPDEIRDMISVMQNIKEFEGIPTLWDNNLLKEA